MGGWCKQEVEQDSERKGPRQLEANRTHSVACLVKAAPTVHSSTTFQESSQTLNLSVALSVERSLGQRPHDRSVSIFGTVSVDTLGHLTNPQGTFQSNEVDNQD